MVHLFRALVHRFPMEELSEAEFLFDKGIAGCIHGRKGSKRQVLLMEREIIEKLRLAPGIVKENVTTQGIELALLTEGQRLAIGEVLLEVTEPCHPCERMDAIRPGLQEELRGQRGVLCRVLSAGRIQAGDSIQTLAPETVPADSRGTGKQIG
ncbi:MAG: MOSC domain-containing protein [Candidatus Acidiferrales bacterium]